MKGSGKLGFYREKVSDFIGIVRAQGIREAMAVAKKFLNRRVDSQEGSREEIESVPPFPEGCIRVLDISYYINCPPTSGGSLRIINPLTRMSPEDGISVDFVFSTWGKEYARDCEEYLMRLPVVRFAKGLVAENYLSHHGSIPEGIPEEVWATMSPALMDYVLDLVSRERYDIIQIEHSQLAWMTPLLRVASPSSKLVLDAHNIEYRIFRTWLPYAEGRQRKAVQRNMESMWVWETDCFPWHDAAFAVSKMEADILCNAKVPRVYQVPTGGGMDPEKYCPKEEHEKDYDMLYIGSMNWFPNCHGLEWFIREVLPLIAEKKPSAVLHIVGNGIPDADLISLCRRNGNVRFWGFQDDDVQFFHRAKVFVVPLWIGAGARVKIPTAWCAKVPVVSTVFGAEGAETVPGENILLEDTPEGFASAVLRLLDDPEEGKRIAENAFETVLEHYSLDRCAQLITDCYYDIAGRKRA